MNTTAVADAAKAYPLAEGKTYSYGTAGFRTDGDLLPGVAFRMGVLMAARSAQKGVATGIMVSASHNPAKDNGMKLVDYNGGMLAQAWESVAERFGNAASGEDVVQHLQALLEEHSIDTTFAPVVIVGRDTRKTGPTMVAAIKAGVAAVGGTVQDHDVVTTPQLHYMVYMQKENPDVAHYNETVANAFRSVRGPYGVTYGVHIDCSNGVGHPQMAALKENITGMRFNLYNGAVEDHASLNLLCGADFVQKEKVAPKQCTPEAFPQGDHLASFDGDADRIVYFYYEGTTFRLLDGDRIAVLYATFLAKLLGEVDVASFTPSIGIVQTAYANGASTTYIRDVLKLEVAFTPTGVKHLHHKAVEYDIGVYFEANGHGTVVFSDEVLATLRSEEMRENAAAQKILQISKLALPVCGDAMADLLLCEAALLGMKWSVEEWGALYVDAPSRMTKVSVPDVQRVKNTWDQMKTTAPEGLQAGIDKVLEDFVPASRSFVRPSGTEPIVRVYAESDTQENADRIASLVEDVVRAHLQ